MRSSLLTATLILLTTVAARADSLNFTTVSDARVFDTGADGTFDSIDSTALTLSVRNFPDSAIDPFEERSIAEFDLSSLPDLAAIDSVSFLFDVRGLANLDTRVDVLGYVGDGVASLSDATVSAVLLGSWVPEELGLGLQSITLNAGSFAGLLMGGPFVGLRFQGITPTNTQFASIEGASLFDTIAPTLSVSFTVIPEPSTLTLLGLGLGIVPLARRGARRGRA